MFRLYEKSLTVANQSCGVGENLELEVRHTKAIKSPFVFLFPNYYVQCGPDIRNLLDVDRLF
jgi:hypothetical protein